MYNFKPNKQIGILDLRVISLMVFTLVLGVYIDSKGRPEFVNASQFGNSGKFEYIDKKDLQNKNINIGDNTWALEKKSGNHYDRVFILENYTGDNIAQWGNYLFFTSGSYSTNVKIYGYNLETDKLLLIYSQDKRNDFENQKIKSTYASLDIEDNTLYFTIGGYLASSAEFAVKLPPKGDIKKLEPLDSTYGKTKIKDHYFIIDGVGDACFGVATFKLVDFENNNILPILDSAYGCNEGDEYIDVDSRDNMIISAHHGYQPTVYTSVSYIPLYNPNQKIELISEGDFPENIEEVVYLDEQDQLLLIGQENYVYDFVTGEISLTDLTKPIEISEDTDVEIDRIEQLVLPDTYRFTKLGTEQL